jgi:hypothetical protein
MKKPLHLLVRDWAYNVFLSWSQAYNAATGGDPDESTSSVIGKTLRAGKPLRRDHIVIFAIVSLVVPNHFYRSIEDDEGGNSAKLRKEIV